MFRIREAKGCVPACLPPRISITYVGTSLAGPPLPWRGYTQPSNGGSPMCMVLQWGQMWFARRTTPLRYAFSKPASRAKLPPSPENRGQVHELSPSPTMTTIVCTTSVSNLSVDFSSSTLYFLPFFLTLIVILC